MNNKVYCFNINNNVINIHLKIKNNNTKYAAV